MNSRMNFGRGFSVPQENDIQMRGPWMPVTPEKPIPPRSNPIPVERQGNQLGRENWPELAGIYGGLLQGTTNHNGVVQNHNPSGLKGPNGGLYNWDVALAEKESFNHNVGSYTQAFGNDSAAWNNSPLAELLGINNAASMASAKGTPNKSNWTESNSTRLLLTNQNHTFSSNQWIHVDSLPQIPKDGFPVPYRPNYNLNSPPRSEADAASSVTNSFHFAPETPDQAKQFENHRRCELLNFSVDESSSQEKDKLETLFTSIGSEAIENHCDELLQNIVDSSSAANSTPLKEKNDFEQGGDGGIDLNKTPQQKTPKRRKHRPKVIVEGKPKRTRKSTTPKNTNSKENPSGKRKYVRKNGLKASATQQAVLTNEVTVPNVESAAQSCRRVLNFDLENERRDESQDKADSHQEEMHQEKRAAFNLNLDSQATELFTRINSNSGSKSIVQLRQQNGHIAGNQQGRITCNLNCSMNQTPAECISLPKSLAPAAPPAAIKDHTLNVIARCVNTRNSNPCQNSGKNGYSQVHQHIHGEELSQIVFQANTTCENFKRTRQLMWQSTPQLILRNVADSNEKRGSKREYCQTIEQSHPCTENLKGSPLLCKETYLVDDYNGSNFGTYCPEAHKKKKSGSGFHATLSSTPCITAVKDSARQVATKGGNGVYENSFTSEINSRRLDSYFESGKTSKKLNNGVNGTASDWCIHSMAAEHNFQERLISSELHSHKERMAEKRSRGSNNGHGLTSITAMTNWNLLSSTHPKKAPASDYVQGIEACHANMSAKKHTGGPTSSNLESSSSDNMSLQEHKDALHGYQQSSMKARGPTEKQKYPVPIDEIIYRLKGLNINGRSNEIVGQEQNALVPYKGDGTIVPYEGFNLIKKRKPRPKVDLDPETNRIWKLLMGKDASEGTEAEGKDKEKWWEEERKVFRGRADSFIARMHLVQGDRRFSQWKGSVVDSVIGVFLTQNVSDHLSSSAFMSLAARFPLQLTTTNQTCYQNGTSILIEEPELRILDPDGTIKCHEKIARQPVYNQSSMTSCESSEHRPDYLTKGSRRTSLANEQNWRAEEEIISSQNSFGSFILQANGEIRSCSGSNSEADPPTGGPTPIKLLHTEKTAAFQEYYSHVIGSSLLNDRFKHGHKQPVDTEYNNQIPRLDEVHNLSGSSAFTYPINSNIPHMQGPAFPSTNFRLHMTPDSGVLEVDCFGVLGEEGICSMPSTAPGLTKVKDVDHMNRRIGQMAESTSKTTVQHNSVPRIQAPTLGPSAFLSKYPTHQESSLQPVPQTGKDQLPINSHQQERSRTFQLESTLGKEPIKPAEALAKMQTGTRQQVPNDPKFKGQTFGLEERISVVDKQKCLENKADEVNAKEQVYSSGEAFSGTDTNIAKVKKGRAAAEAEKKKSFDWDSLRKHVQPSGRRKERSKDTMDSLDYEAVRCADVKEISNAIKERGMNNMLAERIKGFLNRMVREHGSIDLEWLRDVPPDKAKDYLLSIRGLGLKSVECVRLLTLHHLAFPVDTNVGRIAVRLGWVPLQPLPESLQLHLLELYPVLESIQKYLWPRLCKLDQRTLYELHYQMITFGKVFCTKNKPNCNACPMRGECRHFASAFASARLALPGPEEKSIVSSSIPISTDKNPALAIKPMPLPPAENNAPKEAGFITNKCEPFVEEPTTPEPESTEISVSDIEDAFYEDPDEIPTIKLNIEEFTMNLHNYMQENNMELQEGDMSKALVALNPEAASIPTPKLKNVSRLRTEHQVYELPDSHPLLKGLDGREPDDPSPYLLAIWTPGETANSVQPPEISCESQESGKLCNEKTCFSCNSIREANSQTVRGTILIPCRTAMRGSFPLNGTYFQVNEVFADHESSLNPIDVPRAWIWNLPRRTVYFGTSVSSIFKGLSTEGIQYCFWRGFVCVRGFDQNSRAPRPLMARLHFPASKLAKTNKK